MVVLLSLLFASAMPLPPDLERVARVGCKAEEVRQPEGNNIWHVHVWAEYADRQRWIRMASMRSGTDRRKALHDCDDYLKQFGKAHRKTR